jgi:putative two-component system response regulator
MGALTVPAGSSSKDRDPLHAARVLVVDDQEANVVLLQRILELAGVTDIHVLTDSRAAVAQCLELNPDILLLDLHMPHLDGTDVLRDLRAAMPDRAFLPVLMLTADVSSVAREQALDLGARDFLTKPFDRVEVVERVRNLVKMTPTRD